ncbi:MAG: response regulator [Gammaproteobacteria bacterium]|nr:response regulator [Gammaproteobacteria bacterium]
MKKILVVDDSQTILHEARDALERVGYEVFTASNGFEAITQITDHHPDLVFLDIVMPKLDGYKTCSLVKNNETYKDIPVVMVSSMTGLFDRVKGRLVGAEDHINKAFVKQELLDAAQKYLR